MNYEKVKKVVREKFRNIDTIKWLISILN